MTDLNTGDRARVRPVIVAGVIVGRRFDPDTGEKELRLAWAGADGERHERWFKPDELEACADAPGVPDVVAAEISPEDAAAKAVRA